MGLFDFFRRKEEPKKRRVRRYDGAAVGRLTASWTTTSLDANGEIRSNLATLRSRSRDLSRNNDYVKKYLRQVKTNVIGSAGILLQNRAMNGSGKPDEYANDAIGSAWAEWSKKKNASVCGTLSLWAIQNLVVESVARDGEILVRLVRGFRNNRFRFALQLIEADHLDHDLNGPAPKTGNDIKMGVEVDRMGRPVAYWLHAKHPGAWDGFGSQYVRRERVPAEEIVYVGMTERPGQARCVPWIHAAMTRLNNLGGYEEAEIIASRVAAAKTGFFISPDGEYSADDVDDEGNFIEDAEPGSFKVLPQGYDFKAFDPNHPGGNFAPFMKATLRGIASGLGVSYNSLASDLEGVNYSSLRAGTLEERDVWRAIQKWFIDVFLDEVFSAWLEMALLSNAVKLPVSKFEKFNAPTWRPRGWDWVDPAKDISANLSAIGGGLKTRRQALAERGLELEDVYRELAEEKKLAEKYGLTLDEANAAVAVEAKEADDTTDEGKKNEEETD